MFFLPLVAGLAAAPALAAANLVVNTTQGYVTGGPSDYRDGVTVYKGLPFGASTGGANRFRAPQPPASWSGVKNATSFGPMCAQSGSSSADIFDSGSTVSSEDCLFLNIWTPEYNDTKDLASKKLPVYFWIYGGRFEAGSGDVKTYDGSGLASKDIIVVTINYRVGAFGFMAHPDLSAESGHNSSGNYGILDQQYALQWVHDNIANFGGNPDQIVVGGQSAGSASSLDMMWSPLSRDLVAGVISESGALGVHDPATGGAATSYRLKADAESYGVDFLQTLNVSTVAELRNLSTETLINEGSVSDTTYSGTQFENLTSSFMDPPQWRPVIDGYVLTKTYGEALRSGDHGDVPILTGNNWDESGASTSPDLTVATWKEDYTEMFQNYSSKFFELYPATTDTEADESNNDMFRDLTRVGTWQWANDWAAGGALSNVYTYYWNHTPAENAASGAYHGSELWYTFNNIPYASYSNVTWTAQDYQVEKVMAQYWANFIKTCDPNGDGLVSFPPTTKTKATMRLGNTWGMGPLAKTDERASFIEEWTSTLKEW